MDSEKNWELILCRCLEKGRIYLASIVVSQSVANGEFNEKPRFTANSKASG